MLVEKVWDDGGMTFNTKQCNQVGEHLYKTELRDLQMYEKHSYTPTFCPSTDFADVLLLLFPRAVLTLNELLEFFRMNEKKCAECFFSISKKGQVCVFMYFVFFKRKWIGCCI